MRARLLVKLLKERNKNNKSIQVIMNHSYFSQYQHQLCYHTRPVHSVRNRVTKIQRMALPNGRPDVVSLKCF